MKRALAIVAIMSGLLFTATSVSAFSFIDFYNSLFEEVHDFITGKVGGDGGCTPGDTQSCETGLWGICSEGTQTCEPNGDWGACISPPFSSPENNCGDGLDNDCDGRVDSFDPDCYGTCSDGAHNQDEVCADIGGVCGYYESSEDSCQDGKDNDCDGSIDTEDNNCNSCSPGDTDQYCNTGLGGFCTLGIRTCEGTSYGECVAVEGTPESLSVGNCDDGFDNDCDGETDLSDSDCVACTTGSTQSCDNGLDGICGAGIQTCGDSNVWGECIQTVESTNEICADNLDNDCNGQIDEPGCIEDTGDNGSPTSSPPTTSPSIECSPGNSESCITGNPGICSTGTKTCNEDATWSSCLQDTQATIEICNDNLDNDCDGEVDEEDCEENIVGTSPLDCKITEVGWGKDIFSEDYLLKIESEGNCDDSEIEFRIYELDIFINDPIRTQLSTFNEEGGNLLISLPKEEITPFVDGFLEGDTFEVVFEATIRYGDQRGVKSDILPI